MKYHNQQFSIVGRVSLLLALTLSFVAPPTTFASYNSQQTHTPRVPVTDAEKQLIESFNRHVKDYLKQRERAKATIPPLAKNANPEQIDAHQKAFVKALQAMRAGTKAGYIFNPESASYLRAIIKTEFAPHEKAEIRRPALEADNKGVPLKVNYPYPDSKEFTEMPPTLLLKLPQLPKELKYRYVGRQLLLVDTDNNLIVDYMLDALP